MNAPESHPATSSSTSARELARIVRVNEEIKLIVATAFRINLMALNAIFLAKRAGNAALGFGVLSNELRRFAQDLAAQMGALREMTAGIVGAVTSVAQLERRTAILELAARECQRPDVPGLREVRQHGADHLAERYRQFRHLDQRLRSALDDTRQLVELGGVLARAAKIEAAYGGSFSTALMQVSSDFAEVIGQIRASLETLTDQRLGRSR